MSKHFHSCEKCNYKFTCSDKPCNKCLHEQMIVCFSCYVSKFIQFADLKQFNHLIKSNIGFVVPVSYFYSHFFESKFTIIIFF
jgi:hypothetical protein